MTSSPDLIQRFDCRDLTLEAFMRVRSGAVELLRTCSLLMELPCDFRGHHFGDLVGGIFANVPFCVEKQLPGIRLLILNRMGRSTARAHKSTCACRCFFVFLPKESHAVPILMTMFAESLDFVAKNRMQKTRGRTWCQSKRK